MGKSGNTCVAVHSPTKSLLVDLPCWKGARIHKIKGEGALYCFVLGRKPERIVKRGAEGQRMTDYQGSRL